MSRLCIAHGGDVSSPSGGTDRVTALASGLQKRGFEVHLVVPTPNSKLPDKLDEVNVHAVGTDNTFPGPLGRAWAVANAAKRVADQEGARLQFEHSTLAGVATLQGAENFVLDMHDLAYARYDYVDTVTAPFLKRGVAWIERRAVESASNVVAVSEVMRNAIVDQWNVTQSDVTVVPNGYYPERIRPAEDIEKVEGRVAFLGTLHPKVDLEAFEQIASSQRVSEVVVIGDGAQRDDLESLANRNESVTVTGRLPDDEAFAYLASAEVAVNPQTESLLQKSSSPVKLYYYAALGLPMVVAPGPSIVEELAEQDAAVTAQGSREVAETAENLLDDDDQRLELGSNAREAATSFRWTRRIDMIAEFYEQTLGMTNEVKH